MRKWRRAILAVPAMVGLCGAAHAELEAFLDRVRATHPYLQAEALRADAEAERRNRFAGDEDWVATASPSYVYDERVPRGFGAPEEIENLRIRGGVSRKIWSTGGALDLEAEYNENEQVVPASTIPIGDGQTIDVSGPATFFENAVSLSYSHPLLQNRGGVLDRMAWDMQGHVARAARLQALENQENFLARAAGIYIDWTFAHAQRDIAQDRVRLAEEQLAQTERKLEANVVEKVDLFRSRDSLLQTRRALEQAQSAWRTGRARVAALLGVEPAQVPAPGPAMEPDDASLPELSEVLGALRREARALAVIDAQAARVAREREGLATAADARLDVVVSGGLKDGGESRGDVMGYDRVNAGVAVAYRYPLGNTEALSDLRRVAIEGQALASQRDATLRDLEASARELWIRLTSLREVIRLSRERVTTAGEKTAEELRLYEQGRNELTFVIQSRDGEALARLELARNLADHAAAAISLRALRDRLMPGAVADADAGATR